MTELSHKEKVAFSAVKEVQEVTTAEFYQMLERHDWYHSMSDCWSTDRKGRQDREKLEQIADASVTFKSLLEGFSKHFFSGEPWGNEKQPKPNIDEVIDEVAKVELPVYENGAYLIYRPSETSYDSEIWDATTSSEGAFLVKEKDGDERLIGVFLSHADADSAANYSASHSTGGYDDVIIHNVELFENIDKFYE